MTKTIMRKLMAYSLVTNYEEISEMKILQAIRQRDKVSSLINIQKNIIKYIVFYKYLDFISPYLKKLNSKNIF